MFSENELFKFRMEAVYEQELKVKWLPWKKAPFS